MSKAKSKYQGLGGAWRALTEQVKTGKPAPAHPTRLPPSKIKLWPEVFQHRKIIEAQSGKHVQGLATAAARGDLEPVTVWWDGKRWACIDGHHRIDAYKKAGQDTIPVKVFTGTPGEALAEAAQGNTRDKLEMSKAEKIETAWRLVTTAGLSKAQEASASGVSDGLVAKMRRVKNALEKMDEDGADLKWRDAQRKAEGKDLGETWAPEEEDKQVREMVSKLVKTFGKLRHHQLGIFARAVAEYDTRIAENIVQEHHHQTDEDGFSEHQGDEEEPQGPPDGT